MSGFNIPEAGGCRFALMGAGFHLCTMLERLVALRFPKPLVFTYPRAEHERDRRLLTDARIYKDVFATAQRFGVDLVDENLSDAGMVDRMKAHGCHAVFSMSWRRIIAPGMIAAFPGRICNLHPSLLPKERGSGTFTYRILNNSREVSATIHVVDAGLDTGPVLLQSLSGLALDRPKPHDYLIATNALYTELIERFLTAVKAGQTLPTQTQVQDDHTYLPLLHTETNGAIDWSWTADEIERFIRAFGDPYPGAFTFVKDTRLAILDATVEPAEVPFHPYLAGRTLSIHTDGTARVIARDGVLRISEIAIAGERFRPGRFLKPTSALYTPAAVLERARTAVLRANQMNVPDVPAST